MRTKSVYFTGVVFLVMLVFSMYSAYQRALWDVEMNTALPVTILEKSTNDDKTLYFFRVQYKFEEPVTFRPTYETWQTAKVNDILYYRTLLVKPSVQSEDCNKRFSHFVFWLLTVVSGCFFIGSACVTSDDSN